MIHMTHQDFRAIWKASGMTLVQLAAKMRVSHHDTVRRWAEGKYPVPGMASLLMEQIRDGKL